MIDGLNKKDEKKKSIYHTNENVGANTLHLFVLYLWQKDCISYMV